MSSTRTAVAIPVLIGLTVAVGAIAGCRGEAPSPAAGARTTTDQPSVLLVTLDTTRADAMGPTPAGDATPAFTALASRGQSFRYAYATAPETLPSHASIMTGLYPAGHGVHENGRRLPGSHPVVAERLKGAGYRTAAFVSSFVLARRFGLTRGFDLYDDGLPAGGVERSSVATAERVLAYLDTAGEGRLFIWVHFFDPHAPYEPAEPFRSRFADRPYLGEIAAMDAQLARVVERFEARVTGPRAIVVVSDHGEGLGDHGESQHGNLLYQSTMRVPLVLVGPGLAPGTVEEPVSTRRIHHTILDWAGLGSDGSLRGVHEEVVLGEAMKPFLSYGWQPQVMAAAGTRKTIQAGRLETYDVAADPAEGTNLGAGANIAAAVRKALDDYPVPVPGTPPTEVELTEEARRNLASLGYVGATAAPAIRPDAPRPADMTHLFDVLERASALFVAERYREALPLLEKIRREDPGNLDALLRMGAAYSALGQDGPAEKAFRGAAAIAPRSHDVRTYLALHYARGDRWPRAVPLLEEVAAASPDRLPVLEALALVRERQGRIAEAVSLRQKIYGLRDPSGAELERLGDLAMSVQQTAVAIDAFERARTLEPGRFTRDLELGVLYLAARRLDAARTSLDRVPRAHPDYPMALFKRAQVSVLLKEPDRAARVEAARRAADPTTRELIAKEKLFDGLRQP
jgi:tetratricopeptide (TPR) repeat protein